MKIYNKKCDELRDNGGIFKAEHGIRYFKPGYIYHREDGPAFEWTGGDKTWWYNDELIMLTQGDVTPEQLLEFRLKIL